ncbi:hypothetical protein OHB24_28010 [Kribbella sp. NBC_00482]|uniref:hypothetical protein n=1 Tax=Kribbella sp. NBC_00482 TaxID=2975968 RepID=UPI002E183FF4
MDTVNPSAKPTKTPTPVGKVLGTEMVASNNDSMPIMSSAWGNTYERTGLWGGAAIWLTVHSNYVKGKSWGNYVAFGQLPPEIAYTNTPAGLRQAAAQVGGRTLVNLYDKDTQVIKGSVIHKPITINGHPGHEIVAKVPVKVPKLPETFSTIMIAVVDRGDGTAAVSVADLAGSTPDWQNVWRYKVTQMKLSK